MKRLFYSTNDLDDAELISDEVHKQGVDDEHFFVLSRDDKGILSHHLHGDIWGQIKNCIPILAEGAY